MTGPLEAMGKNGPFPGVFPTFLTSKGSQIGWGLSTKQINFDQHLRMGISLDVAWVLMISSGLVVSHVLYKYYLGYPPSQ